MDAPLEVTWHAMPVGEVVKRLATSAEKGLGATEASARLQKYGPNRLPEGKKLGPLKRFLSQFNNILVYVLLAAGFTKLMLLAELISKRADRFRGFAALPLQDPDAAALEARRCVADLGFVGALVNGFSQVGDDETVVYLDDGQYRGFWTEFANLNRPFYLHPRDPIASGSRIYTVTLGSLAQHGPSVWRQRRMLSG